MIKQHHIKENIKEKQQSNISEHLHHAAPDWQQFYRAVRMAMQRDRAESVLPETDLFERQKAKN